MKKAGNKVILSGSRSQSRLFFWMIQFFGAFIVCFCVLGFFDSFYSPGPSAKGVNLFAYYLARVGHSLAVIFTPWMYLTAFRTLLFRKKCLEFDPETLKFNCWPGVEIHSNDIKRVTFGEQLSQSASYDIIDIELQGLSSQTKFKFFLVSIFYPQMFYIFSLNYKSIRIIANFFDYKNSEYREFFKDIFPIDENGYVTRGFSVDFDID